MVTHRLGSLAAKVIEKSRYTYTMCRRREGRRGTLYRKEGEELNVYWHNIINYIRVYIPVASST